MIEVVVTRSGRREDTATALTPEAALLAARTLVGEARAATPYQGAHRLLDVHFVVDGQTVATVEGKRP